MIAAPSCTEPGRFPSVLVMSSTFPRWPGDSTPRFVHHLAELATNAWNVTVLAPHHPGAALDDAWNQGDGRGTLEVRRFPYWFPRSHQRLCYGGGILPNARASLLALVQVPSLALAELAAMRRLLGKSRHDLVHAHFLVPQGMVAALGARRPLVVSIHGSDLFALRGRVIDRAVRHVIARAAVVTVNGQVAADEAMRRFPEIATKLRLLPMSIDTTVFRPPSRPEHRAPASAPVIAFVGRLSEQKGVHVLLDAFARLRDRERARLVIAGEGPELDRLRALAAKERRVDFVGPLSSSGIAELLQQATMLVVPSLEGLSGTEAQGLAAIEAMASSCPIVVSRSGGLAELAGDERGIAVPPSDPARLADAIERCLADPAAARARTERARRFAIERYDAKHIGESLLAIYDEAMRC